jgi:hypothetical protein
MPRSSRHRSAHRHRRPRNSIERRGNKVLPDRGALPRSQAPSTRRSCPLLPRRRCPLRPLLSHRPRLDSRLRRAPRPRAREGSRRIRGRSSLRRRERPQPQPKPTPEPRSRVAAERSPTRTAALRPRSRQDSSSCFAAKAASSVGETTWFARRHVGVLHPKNEPTPACRSRRQVTHENRLGLKRNLGRPIFPEKPEVDLVGSAHP